VELFAGKTALVTGATGGIAKEVVRNFIKGGANVALTDLNDNLLKEFVGSLDVPAERYLTVAGDVSSSGFNDQLVQAAVDKFARIDCFVPCAGIYPEAALTNISDADWRKVMSINLDGVFYGTRAVLPHMPEGSAIVNITSLAADRGSRNHSAYSATKGALLAFTRSTALEAAPRVRVNAVAPGVIDTAMVGDLMAADSDRILSATPLGRMGTAKEVAEVVTFLCTPAAGFITGEVIRVNGGIHMAG